MYAICRSLKIKNPADISASDNHCQRVEGNQTNRAHINSELSKYNITRHHFIHEDGSPMGLNEVVNDFMKCDNIKIPRKDSVRMVEYVLSISHAYFDGCDVKKGLEDEKIRKFVDGADVFLNKEPYTLCLNWHLHLDESTPHIHAHCIIATQSKKGIILNASKVLGGKKKLSALQDRYHQTMLKYVNNIKRGISSDITKVSHTTIKEFHTAMKKLKNIGFNDEMVSSISNKLIKEPDKGLESAIYIALEDPEIFRKRAEELMKQNLRKKEQGFSRNPGQNKTE